jgi:hypothetical protein
MTLILIARNGPAYASIPYRNFFLFRILYRHVSICHRYHYQWHHSPINDPWLILGCISLEDSQQIHFYSLMPNPQSGGPGLHIYALLETGLPSYTAGHWVACVPRIRHFPYPLTWDPEGLINMYYISIYLSFSFFWRYILVALLIIRISI